MQPEKNPYYLQATFSVSSKNFKKAVERNRIKRVMREAYRLQKNSLQNQLKADQKNLAIFIIYNDKKLPEFENIFEKMHGALDRLSKIISLQKE